MSAQAAVLGRSGFGGIILIAVLLVAKSAKLVKAAAVAKPAIALLSMALSAFAYAFWLGPWLAIGFVTLLFVHEMGHVVALRARGYPVSGMVFIPFLGAAVFSPKLRDRDSEAFVGYGGPLLGTVGALIPFGLWFAVPQDSDAAHVLLMTSYAAVWLNLFNLLPVQPLDGGRIAQATGHWVQYAGLAALALWTASTREPVILFVWILVISELRFMRPRLRAFIAAICAAGMVALFALGYGHQPWWVSAFDSVVALALVVSMALAASGADEAGQGPDLRPALPAGGRLRWTILYLALTSFLTLLLLVQSALLPVPA